MISKRKTNQAFTIVELLVVIVVIGILAAITIVSYSGISTRAKVASLQSDLTNSSKLLKIFYIDNGMYPSTISTNCTTTPTTTTNLCLKPSNGTDFEISPYSRPTPSSFVLTATNGTLVYRITEDSNPIAGVYIPPTLATTDPANWIQIGTQVWARYNLNLGTRINGTQEQTNNGGSNVVEKYCYGNSEANCTLNNNGGLYQWNEAMSYSITEGIQGICPANSHIPTDNEWKILEVQLGMTQAQADNISWRGVDQGTKLKPSGISGLNIPLAGYRDNSGSFSNMSSYAHLWSSSESSSTAWSRYLKLDNTTVNRDTSDRAYGFSVRCLGN